MTPHPRLTLLQPKFLDEVIGKPIRNYENTIEYIAYYSSNNVISDLTACAVEFGEPTATKPFRNTPNLRISHGWVPAFLRLQAKHVHVTRPPRHPRSKEMVRPCGQNSAQQLRAPYETCDTTIECRIRAIIDKQWLPAVRYKALNSRITFVVFKGEE